MAVSKQVFQTSDVERFHCSELSALEVTKQYQSKISNTFAALEKLYYGEDIHRAWKNIKENITTSVLCGLKQHKPWFNEECLRFLDQSKQTKMQRLQDSNQSKVDKLNYVRREARRHFMSQRSHI